jgi:hypothetical protein
MSVSHAFQTWAIRRSSASNGAIWVFTCKLTSCVGTRFSGLYSQVSTDDQRNRRRYVGLVFIWWSQAAGPCFIHCPNNIKQHTVYSKFHGVNSSLIVYCRSCLTGSSYLTSTHTNSARCTILCILAAFCGSACRVGICMGQSM